MVNQAKYSIRSVRRDERGQVLALAAVSMVAVIAVGALAVDLGMAFAARAAAQRAADSSALAGASAFIDYNWSEPFASDTAEARAYEYALNNDVIARPIDPSQVTVWVIPDSQKVRVRIAATELPTWFARVLGVFSMDVAALSAAVASDGGTSDKCVLPFAMADLWHDVNDDTNRNRIPDMAEDGPEEWTFEPNKDDLYEPFNGEVGFDGYGLGSSWRNPPYGGWSEGGPEIFNDLGRKIWIKGGPPGHAGGGSGGEAGGTDIMIGPGNFYIWNMPDPDEGCEALGSGAADLKTNLHIENCNPCPISLGVTYQTQTGNIAAIKDPLELIMASDPGASWNDESNEFVPSEKYPGETSPRIRIVPLWDPVQVMKGKSPIEFNNFAKIFLEGGGKVGGDFAVYARFMGVITGGAGPTTGSLVKYLRLVE